MGIISDGNTDLLSTLLSNSQDTSGKPIKWKKDKDEDSSLPSWSAEVKNEDGSTSFYNINASRAMAVVGVRNELSEEQKKAQEERNKKTNLQGNTVVQTSPATGKPSGSEDIEEKRAKKDAAEVAKEAPDSKTRKEAEKVSRY